MLCGRGSRRNMTENLQFFGFCCFRVFVESSPAVNIVDAVPLVEEAAEHLEALLDALHAVLTVVAVVVPVVDARRDRGVVGLGCLFLRL